MFRQVIGYGIAVLVLAFLTGLVALNYSALAALILGAIISWPVVRLLRFIVTNRTRILVAGVSTLIICFIVCSFLYLGLLFPLHSSRTLPPLINEYYLTIDPLNWESGVFSIKETVAIDPRAVENYGEMDIPARVELPEREVTSTAIGLLTEEVNITPIQAESPGYVTITLPDGRTLGGSVCSYSCENIYIELHDAPTGSFLAAKDSENIQQHPYINTETISWSVINLEQGITFAFVPPPFHHVRPIIEPLLGASTLNEWVLGFLGLIGTILITPIVKPVILKTAQKTFGSWLDRQSGAKAREEINMAERIAGSPSVERARVSAQNVNYDGFLAFCDDFILLPGYPTSPPDFTQPDYKRRYYPDGISPDVARVYLWILRQARIIISGTSGRSEWIVHRRIRTIDDIRIRIPHEAFDDIATGNRVLKFVKQIEESTAISRGASADVRR